MSKRPAVDRFGLRAGTGRVLGFGRPPGGGAKQLCGVGPFAPGRVERLPKSGLGRPRILSVPHGGRSKRRARRLAARGAGSATGGREWCRPVVGVRSPVAVSAQLGNSSPCGPPSGRGSIVNAFADPVTGGRANPNAPGSGTVTQHGLSRSAPHDW